MRCRKARELYFKNRDGLLKEAAKMKLQEHLHNCQSCTSFAGEMDRSLDLLGQLPEVSPSEGFEWNLKRRILHEKARVMRRQETSFFGEWRWGRKFVASAAAVAAIAFTGMWLIIEGDSQPTSGPKKLAKSSRSATVRKRSTLRDYGIIDFAGSGSTEGKMIVSNGITSVGSSGQEYARQLPFQFAEEPGETSLRKQNELLRIHIENLERENLILRRLLSKERTRR